MKARIALAADHFLAIVLTSEHSQGGFDDSSSLFHRDVDQVLIFQSQLLCCVIWSNAFTIYHEADLRGLQTKAAAVCIHELPQRSGLLDLELDLTALLILNFQLDVCGCCIFGHLEKL